MNHNQREGTVKKRLLIPFLLAAACGGGGGGSSTGFLDVVNQSSSWRYGECGIQVAVTRVGTERTEFATLGGCGTSTFELPVGSYNVEARGTSACQSPYRQTFEVRENLRTTLPLSCSACGSCS